MRAGGSSTGGTKLGGGAETARSSRVLTSGSGSIGGVKVGSPRGGGVKSGSVRGGGVKTGSMRDDGTKAGRSGAVVSAARAAVGAIETW